MTKIHSYVVIISLLLFAPQSASAGSLRGKVAFNSKLLKIAVDDWVENSTTACLRYGGHISEWDTSRVYNMTSLFANAVDFDDDISRWNVTNVRDFRFAFANASSFRGNLSSWDTSNVKNMKHMFHGASSFGSDLSSWNTSNVLNFSYMFAEASSFNGNVSTFDVTSAHDLSFMFHNAKSFNQDVSEWTREDLSEPGFRVKWVQDMRSMFHGASSFQGGGMSNWQTFAVYDMNSMFKDATSFTEDISSWNVKNVKDFREMFAGSAFSQHLCWDMQSGAETKDMFAGTSGSLWSNCKHEENQRIIPEVALRAPDLSSSATLSFSQAVAALTTVMPLVALML